jgi:hypothetical protein
MRSKTGSLGLLIGVFLVSAACSIGSNTVSSGPGNDAGTTASARAAAGSPTPRSASTESPTVTRVPTTAPRSTATVGASSGANPAATEPSLGPIIFQDDFSDPNSGWGNADLDSIGVGYDSGEYRIIVKRENILSFAALPVRQFDDVSIEADARLASGPSSSVFGLLCRATAESTLQTGYEFLITGAGQYGVVKVTGPNPGQEQVLGSEGTSSAIHAGNATNHLRADCSGDHIVMFVNGQKVIDQHDSDFKAGQIGFAFGTLNGNSGFEVRFDNFVVRQAKP